MQPITSCKSSRGAGPARAAACAMGRKRTAERLCLLPCVHNAEYQLATAAALLPCYGPAPPGALPSSRRGWAGKQNGRCSAPGPTSPALAASAGIVATSPTARTSSQLHFSMASRRPAQWQAMRRLAVRSPGSCIANSARAALPAAIRTATDELRRGGRCGRVGRALGAASTRAAADDAAEHLPAGAAPRRQCTAAGIAQRRQQALGTAR